MTYEPLLRPTLSLAKAQERNRKMEEMIRGYLGYHHSPYAVWQRDFPEWANFMYETDPENELSLSALDEAMADKLKEELEKLT